MYVFAIMIDDPSDPTKPITIDYIFAGGVHQAAVKVADGIAEGKYPADAIAFQAADDDDNDE